MAFHKAAPAGQPFALLLRSEEEGCERAPTGDASCAFEAVRQGGKRAESGEGAVVGVPTGIDIDCLRGGVAGEETGEIVEVAALLLSHIVDVGEVGVKLGADTEKGQHGRQKNSDGYDRPAVFRRKGCKAVQKPVTGWGGCFPGVIGEGR